MQQKPLTLVVRGFVLLKSGMELYPFLFPERGITRDSADMQLHASRGGPNASLWCNFG